MATHCPQAQVRAALQCLTHVEPLGNSQMSSVLSALYTPFPLKHLLSPLLPSSPISLSFQSCSLLQEAFLDKPSPATSYANFLTLCTVSSMPVCVNPTVCKLLKAGSCLTSVSQARLVWSIETAQYGSVWRLESGVGHRLDILGSVGWRNGSPKSSGEISL